MRQDRPGTLRLTLERPDRLDNEVRALLFCARLSNRLASQRRKLLWKVEWHGHPNDTRLHGFLDEFRPASDVAEVRVLN